MPTGDRRLDQFESMFRSAYKEVFHYQPPSLNRALVISDRDPEVLAVESKRFLSAVGAQELDWQLAGPDRWSSIEALLQLIQDQQPDLIVTTRHLGGPELPNTLGSVVDTLTQATDVPVLLIPRPDVHSLEACLKTTERVLVITNHITGDDALVSWAVRLSPNHGNLLLAHIEDDATLERYLDAIGKISGIDSNTVRERLPDKLLQLPREYIETITGVLAEQGLNETVTPLVRFGHAITDVVGLVREHSVDLIIINTKDADQDAMHAMAHGLAVAIRDRALLLL